MRKPKSGEVWRHQNGYISLIYDRVTVGINDLDIAKAKFGASTADTPGSYDDNGYHLHPGCNPALILTTYLGSILADVESKISVSNQEPDEGCNHEFVNVGFTSITIACKYCGESK